MDSGSWGKSASIDLFDCKFELLAQKEALVTFIAQVIELIGMKAHGPTYIDRFGSGDLEGWSAMQFIETSSITLHADEFGKRCFIDIFSCKDFNENAAYTFAKKYFEAQTGRLSSQSR